MGLFNKNFKLSNRNTQRAYETLKSSKYDVLESKTNDYQQKMKQQKDQKQIIKKKVRHHQIFKQDDKINYIYLEDKNNNTEMVKFRVKGKTLNLCRTSCCLFDPKNKLRQKCLIVSEHKSLEIFIVSLIVFHSILLSQYDFHNYQNQNNQIFDLIFFFFNSVYFFEILIKIIAKGLLNEKNTYLRSLYNCIDFLCNIFFFLGINNVEYRYYEILKLFRSTILLRQFLGFKNLDLLMNVTKNSFQYTLTILGFLFYILGMLAILGLTLFQGLFNYRCRLTSKPVNGQWPVNQDIKRLCSISTSFGYQCPDGNYCGSDYQYRNLISPQYFLQSNKIQQLNYGITKYDSFYDSILVSFQLLQKTDWQDIMYLSRDIYRKEISYFYIIFLIIICNYFISNMIVASMMQQYNILTQKNQRNHYNQYKIGLNHQNDFLLKIVSLIQFPFLLQVQQQKNLVELQQDQNICLQIHSSSFIQINNLYTDHIQLYHIVIRLISNII